MFKNLLFQNKLVENVVVYNDRTTSEMDDECFSKIKSNKGVGGLIIKLRELNKKRSAQGLSLLVLAIPLSACGGGDDAALTEVTGRAIDGYLANSKVFLSSNPDVFVRTSDAVGSQGSFEGLFGTGSIVVREGIDISTGKSFTGELKAPEGSKVVTPITTIVEAVVSQAASAGNSSVTPEIAAQQVAKGLGLQSTSDILNTDFVESGSAGMAKAAAKVASVISVVTASTGDEVSAAVLGNIAQKVAKAGEVGGKANVLNDAAELKEVFQEVRTTQAELFLEQPETLDLDVLIDNVSNVVAKVSAQVDAAASLKDIAATQQAVQDDIVVAFTVDAENPEAFDPTVFEAALAEIDEGFEAIIAEAAVELETYIETADTGIDFEVILDVADVDESVVLIDLDIIDGAIEGTIPDELVTGFVFGEVELDTLDGVLDGTIDAAAVDEILASLPEFEVFPEIPPITDVPVDIPVDELPVEIPTDVAAIIAGGGGGGGGAAVVTGDVINVYVSSGGSIANALALAKLSVDDATDNIVVNLASGRYSENVTIDAAALGVASVTINGANSGVSLAPNVSKSADITTTGTAVASSLAYDTADGSRGNNESWIDGAITVASDNVTLDGLRLHSYNGALKFNGTDIDNFTVKNSYITGFNGADSFRYSGDGTNNGWNITGNMIGGVSGGVGGSLYLDSINAATITENVFFRPAAAHMYLTDTDNVSVSSNLFFHGVHADGANFDGQLAAFQAADANGYGYVGFSGGTGYGYGFGYGYGSSSGAAITEMGSYGGYGGKGPSGYAPSGYGLDSYSGGGSSQADYLFYGRNYIAEVKGDSDTISFDGNWGLYNSGGIQFWDEGISGHHFNQISITDNQMAAFINADQDGLLASLSSRHKSGLVGGLVFQVNDGNGSEDLVISGNKIYGSIDQIKNVNDLDALVEVGGGVKDVDITGNTLSWNLSNSFSGTIEALNDNSADKKQADQTSGSTTYQVHTQGVLLYGDIEDTIVATGTFATDKIADNSALTNEYISHAILLVDDASSVPSALGTLTANVNHSITTADYGSSLPLVTINNTDTDAYAGTLTNLLL